VFAKRKFFFLLIAAVFLLSPKDVLAANFGDVVINEVYYDVCSKGDCGGDRGEEGKNEWVEIYNCGKEDINLKGWKIKDTTDNERIIIESDLFLCPGKFALITNNVSTWNFWDIPGNVLKISLGENIGGGLNNEGDKVILVPPNNFSVESIEIEYGKESLPHAKEGHSLERIPAVTGDLIEQEDPTPGRGIFTLTPTATMSPSPTQLTPSPTLITTLTTTPVLSLTLTPTPTPAKAIYQINEVKNEDGDILSAVKIYIDDQYIHHYAPEILEFCDGCYCDDDKEVKCGFGDHTIRLEKNNYQDWEEAKKIGAGDNHKADPIMDLLSLTAIPTSKITPTSTATLNSLTLSPTLTAPLILPMPSFFLQVHSLVPKNQDSISSASTQPEVLGEQSERKGTLPSLLFWSGGIFYIVFPIYWLRRRWYNDFNEKVFVLD